LGKSLNIATFYFEPLQSSSYIYRTQVHIVVSLGMPLFSLVAILLFHIRHTINLRSGMQRIVKFRHFIELRGFLPFIPSIDLDQGWDNRKIIEKYHVG
jgi:hypothetical protein